MYNKEERIFGPFFYTRPHYFVGNRFHIRIIPCPLQRNYLFSYNTNRVYAKQVNNTYHYLMNFTEAILFIYNMKLFKYDCIVTETHKCV